MAARRILSQTWKTTLNMKYVVKHKSAKLLITYAVGKLEAALNICHLIVNIKYKQSES